MAMPAPLIKLMVLAIWILLVAVTPEPWNTSMAVCKISILLITSPTMALGSW